MLGRESPIPLQAGATSAATPLKTVLADPTVWGNFVMHFVVYWTLAGALIWLLSYFEKGLGFDSVTAGRSYGLVIALTIPVVLVASAWSQRLLARGWRPRDARGRFSAVSLALAGLVFATLLLPGLPTCIRVLILAPALGFTPPIYALGPAMLAQVSPPGRRAVVPAIDNSVASIADILAPAVFGALIDRFPGARGYELGFFVIGVILLAGAGVGWFAVDPERSMAKAEMARQRLVRRTSRPTLRSAGR